jgi:hypothetical protein
MIFSHVNWSYIGMKILRTISLAVAAVAFSYLPVAAEETITQVLTLPNTGTYFIVNADNGEALQPVAASLGQNVFTHEFNKSGTEMWAITRKIDPVTHKPTNRYTVKLAGQAPSLNFQPHPATDSSAIVSTDASVFVLEPDQSGIVVKSVAKNGDALYIYPSPPGPTETRFGPSDGSKKYHWAFIGAPTL